MGIVDVVQIDDVYAVPDADDANTTDGASTRWRESGMYADVTLSSGAAATDVPESFLMQDKVLWVALSMKTLSDARCKDHRHPDDPRHGKSPHTNGQTSQNGGPGIREHRPTKVGRSEEPYSFVYDVDDEMGASRGREKHPCFYDASGGF